MGATSVNQVPLQTRRSATHYFLLSVCQDLTVVSSGLSCSVIQDSFQLLRVLRFSTHFGFIMGSIFCSLELETLRCSRMQKGLSMAMTMSTRFCMLSGVVEFSFIFCWTLRIRSFGALISFELRPQVLTCDMTGVCMSTCSTQRKIFP